MSLTSVQCTILMGSHIPAPIPRELTEAVQAIEIIHHDSERSGFEITFAAARCRANIIGEIDYPLLQHPLLKTFNRVIILITINAMPRMLMDGVITFVQLNPGTEPGMGKIIVTGEDISVMMDLEEKIVAHPAQSEMVIANKIVGDYSQYAFIPEIIAPPLLDTPNPTDYIPMQNETDFAYLKRIAARFGYVFYIATGPVPFVNTAYWGPPKKFKAPQPALSVNVGLGRNVNDITFNYDDLKPATIIGKLQDREFDQQLPIDALIDLLEPLSQQAKTSNRLAKRRRQLGNSAAGLSYQQALARAQANADTSLQDAVTATGSLDIDRYGDILQARSLVGVRGAGKTYDGLYYVKKVVHNIGAGFYKQQFTLNRDGTGTTVSRVIP